MLRRAKLFNAFGVHAKTTASFATPQTAVGDGPCAPFRCVRHTTSVGIVATFRCSKVIETGNRLPSRVLLAGLSRQDLAPVGKSVEARRKGKLLFAGAVRINQNQLELTASSYAPVEHDLLAIG